MGTRKNGRTEPPRRSAAAPRAVGAATHHWPSRRAGELERGRAAVRRRAWGDAYAALARADQRAPLAIEDLERLSLTAALTGRDEEFLRLLERRYHAHLQQKDESRAARAAFWLGMRLFALGEPSRAGGWLARSQRLVEGRDCAEQGYLMLPVIHRHHAAGDHDSAASVAATAAAIGDRFNEEDLSAFARSLQGRAVLRLGRIEAGLALLDEAMIAATTGELSPVVTGLIYCSSIASCQQVLAIGGMREWTAALGVWCEAQSPSW